jgi:hypothetical protein
MSNPRRSKVLLEGAYDMHIHCSPDVVKRAQYPADLAKAAFEAGMAGIGIKDHTTSTVGIACVLNRMYPERPHFFGALALNPPVGGLNLIAVEAALCQGADIVYFPTYGTRRHVEMLGCGPFPLPEDFKGITVLDEASVLRPEVEAILRLIAEYDAVLATGHLSPQESQVLLKRARELGVVRMVVTHASEPVTLMSVAQQFEAVGYGAFIEHSFLAVTETCGCMLRLEEMQDQIRQVGAEHIILSSDFGQVANGPPIEGFAHYLEKLRGVGVSDDEIRVMISDNPERLLANRHSQSK